MVHRFIIYIASSHWSTEYIVDILIIYLLLSHWNKLSHASCSPWARHSNSHVSWLPTDHWGCVSPHSGSSQGCHSSHTLPSLTVIFIVHCCQATGTGTWDLELGTWDLGPGTYRVLDWNLPKVIAYCSQNMS